VKTSGINICHSSMREPHGHQLLSAQLSSVKHIGLKDKKSYKYKIIQINNSGFKKKITSIKILVKSQKKKKNLYLVVTSA